MKRRSGDILFIIFATFIIPVCYWDRGLEGFATLTVAFFLPLYVMRLVIWSSWSRLHPWLLANTTPRSWAISVFTMWGCMGVLVWLTSPVILNSLELSLPRWVQPIGIVIAAVGLFLALWAQWLLGFQTAILTTRIFESDKKEQTRVVSTGPYALSPHPIFLGEWLIISGCFLLTSQIFLLVLLLIAFLTDMFAAREEEKDLQSRFGEEYKIYRSQFSFSSNSTSKRDD